MKKIKNIFWNIVIVGNILLGIYFFGYAFLNNHLVQGKDAVYTKGIIINEENFKGNHSHIGNDFTYSYEFVVNGKKYKGNSHDPTVKIGDSVEVKYNRHCPYFNKPTHPRE